MILPGGPMRVFVATKPVDFRKGIDGRAALARAGSCGSTRSQGARWCSGRSAPTG